MIHLVLKCLAEWPASDTNLLLGVWERHLAYAGRHAILFHHGVGNTRHLPQIILSACVQGSYILIK